MNSNLYAMFSKTSKMRVNEGVPLPLRVEIFISCVV